MGGVWGGGLPEDFLWSQTLKVGAHGVKALERSLDTQRAEDVLRAHPVEVKGDAGDVLPGAGLIAAWGSEDDRALADQTQ